MRAFRTRLLGALFTTAPLAAAASPAHAQAAPPSDSAIRTVIRMRVDSGTAAGIVVGILDAGARRFVSYGSAGPGRAPLDQHTIFEIGSITKTFNALLLADAVGRGEVALDQPVAGLLPAGTKVPSRDGREITLEHLATHRSGLPRLPSNMAPARPADPYADYDAQRLYTFLASHQLARAPGDSADYSNLGGGLLGHALVLRARARSWGELAERRITQPLGMRETFVDVPPSLRMRASAGHGASLDTVPAWHLDALAGAGALRSTAADMLTYLEAHLDTTRGPLARAIALGIAPRARFAPGLRIALGWIVAGEAPRAFWWHNGGTGGFRSFAAFDPARRIGIVVLSNSELSVDDIGTYVLGIRPAPGLPARVPRVALTLSAAAMDRLVGAYPLTPAFVLTITREGETLFVQATGQPRIPLVAKSEHEFVIPIANAELAFDVREPGLAKSVTLRQNGATLMGARTP